MTVKHWDVAKMGNGEQGTRKRGWKNEKWDQNTDFEIKLLRGLGLKLGFVPIFHFPVPRARYLLFTF